MSEPTAATAFFNPTSPFGSLTGWGCINVTPATSKQRAQALGSTGDELAFAMYDEKESVTAEYFATSDSAAIPVVGSIKEGYHIDSVAVNFSNTAYVTMSVTGHKHGSSAHPACRTYTGSLTTIGVKFGCPAAPLGVVIPTGAGVRSVSYNIQLNHVDELGAGGTFLAAENYDGSETVTVELCDTNDITAASGWSLTQGGHTFDRTSVETSTATVEKHITGVTPSNS